MIVEAQVTLSCAPGTRFEAEVSEKMATLREELLGKLSEHLVQGKRFMVQHTITDAGGELVLEYRALEIQGRKKRG